MRPNINGADAGFVYLNKSEVDDGVSAEQLKNIVKEYVSGVYATDGQDLYDVLLYQYDVLVYQYDVLLYQYHVLLYQYDVLL